MSCRTLRYLLLGSSRGGSRCGAFNSLIAGVSIFIQPLFHCRRMEEEDRIRQQVLKSTLQEVRATPKDTDEPLDPCVICLDSISERAIASPCRHDSFDFLCLISWLQERSSCPLC